MKTFDGIDHQITPEKFSHQIDARTIFSKVQQPLDLDIKSVTLIVSSSGLSQQNTKRKICSNPYDESITWNRFTSECHTIKTERDNLVFQNTNDKASELKNEFEDNRR